MTSWQKAIKYCAMAFAIFLTVSIVGGIVGGISGVIGSFVFSDSAVLDELKTYTVSSDLKGLIIDIDAAELTIKTGDTFSLESNLENIKVEEDNNRLSVEEDSNWWFGASDNGVVVLTLPEDYVFNDVNISAGAGVLSVDGITANDLEIELGAGKSDIKNITTNTKADIEGGAGKLTLTNCTLHNLDLELGVGEVSFSGVIAGHSNVECGVGEVNMTLGGNKNDYVITVEKGLGDISVDGESVDNEETIGNGTNRLEISGGVGEVKVDFVGD